MTTIETKFAKNGSLICKINGKRAKRETVEEAIRHANIYGDNVEIKNEFGSVYTSKFNGDIYRFADQYGNKETFVYADDVVYKLARVHFDAPATAPVEVKAEAAPATAETANVEETAEAKAVEETANAEESVEKINNILNAYETESGNAATDAGYKVVAYYGAETALPDTVCRTYATMEAAKAAAEYLTDAGAILYYGISDNRPIIDINAGVFAASVIAPAKMLALPAPAEVKAGAEPKAETPTIKADLAIVEESDADYKRTAEIVELYKRRDAAKAFLAETVDFYKGALELGDTETFKALGKERSEHHKTIIACTKRLRELGAIPETIITGKPEVYGDTAEPVDEPPKPPVDEEPNSPCAVANNLTGVIQTTFRGVDYMDFTTQSGAHIVSYPANLHVEPDWESDNGYVIANSVDTFAHYETAEQVIDVMTALHDTVKAGKTEFTFPAETVAEPPEPPVDEFSATLAALDANIANAEADRSAAKAAYDLAETAVQNAARDRQAYLDSIAGNLTRKLQSIPPHRGYIDIATIDECVYSFANFDEMYIDSTIFDGSNFAFNHWDGKTFARYATPAQVEQVIARLKGAVENHEPVFYFPTVKELAKLETPKPPVKPEPDMPVADKPEVFDESCDDYASIDNDDNYEPDYCNECGKPIPEDENGIWGYPVSIFSAPGYHVSSKYAEPLCEECFDKFYVECAQCMEYYHKDCCKQLDNGEWICDVCQSRDASSKSLEPAPDTVAAVARICATVNAAAPRGWEIYYDASTKLFEIEHDSKPVARLTSVELYDAWDAHPPEDFFDAYALPAVEFDEHGNITDIWF